MTRLGLAAFAVVLSTVLVPLGITSTWLSLRVDSTEAYVDTVAPLADDEKLRDALAEEVAAAAIAIVQERVPVGLPGTFREIVRSATTQVVENDEFPRFWRTANAETHREFLSIVHDRNGATDTDGWVLIDLRPLLDGVLNEVEKELPAQLRVDLPSQSLPVPIMPESKLAEVRGGYRLLEGLALWVPLLWAGLVALAVVVAPGWRGRLRAGAACAGGVVIGGGIVLLLTAPVTDVVVDQVDPEKRDLARLVVEVVVRSLDETAMGAVVIGVVAAVALVGASLWPRRRAHAAHS